MRAQTCVPAQGYENPHAFDPDRFGPERQEDVKYASNFLVFGHGPHYCVGKEVCDSCARMWLTAGSTLGTVFCSSLYVTSPCSPLAEPQAARCCSLPTGVLLCELRVTCCRVCHLRAVRHQPLDLLPGARLHRTELDSPTLEGGVAVLIVVIACFCRAASQHDCLALVTRGSKA